jgi:hypothetical protein
MARKKQTAAGRPKPAPAVLAGAAAGAAAGAEAAAATIAGTGDNRRRSGKSVLSDRMYCFAQGRPFSAPPAKGKGFPDWQSLTEYW